MDIQIVTHPIPLNLVEQIASQQFGTMVKATADIQRGLMALGGDLHADEEQLLLEDGSKQKDLWGINLYPSRFKTAGFIEFDSMINLRPSQGNRSRYVENELIRKQISELVASLVTNA